MQRDYGVRGWFWWMTIAACGLSFVVALDPATASETPQRAASPAAAPSVAKAGPHSRAAATSLVRWRAEPEVPEPRWKPSAAPAELGEPSVRGLRRLAASEVSAEMLVVARHIIRQHHRARPGTGIAFESGGQTYVARVERHYHPEGGPVKPWGYHPGVSLLKAVKDRVD